MKGMVHLYTGDGKGKTTAAVGLAVRAWGAGFRVFIAQFIKDNVYHEIDVLAKWERITVELFGKGCFLTRPADAEDKAAARKGLRRVKEILKEGLYDLVILDEVTFAVNYGFFSAEELLQGLKDRDEKVEVVLTGRAASSALEEAADLVTEMREIKHYYRTGLLAREGIER
jgi:cob(I)alamin adenosyltransferase